MRSLLDVVTRFIRTEEYISCWVSLLPDKETEKNLFDYRNELRLLHDFDGMREPYEFHATVRWWKPAKNVEPIAEKLESIPFERTEAKAIGVHPLGDSLSLILESQGMQNIFDMVDSVARGLGAPNSDFPSYKPHVALFYHDSFRNGNDPKIDYLPSFPIIFDKIKFRDKVGRIYVIKGLR